MVSGFLALNQYQENWIDYRTTCESLRHHKYRFLTGAEPYLDQGDAFGHLVNNTEDLISKENTKLGQLHQRLTRRSTRMAKKKILHQLRL